MSAKESQFLILEDEIDAAEGYVRHTGVSDLMDNVAYFTNDMELFDALTDKLPTKIFWIDLNLGNGEEDRGLEVVKLIRPQYPEALIIIYTAHGDLKKDCFDAGANHFFKKGGNYDETMLEIKRIITNFLKKNGLKFSIVEFEGEVAHIEGNWVTIECMQGDKSVEKSFPRHLIEEAVGRPMALDLLLKFKAVHKQGTFTVTISEIDRGAAPEENSLPEDLLDSDIWDNELP